MKRPILSGVAFLLGVLLSLAIAWVPGGDAANGWQVGDVVTHTMMAGLESALDSIDTDSDGAVNTLEDTAITAQSLLAAIGYSADIQAIVSDGTGYGSGSGVLVMNNGPQLINPIFALKTDWNDVAVSDDDCTGEQGKAWYDSTDSAFEFCTANSGTPLNIISTAPADAEYLVSTANGSLSAEDVFTDGTAIDSTNGAGTLVVSWDSTEVAATTWGSGSAWTWTFNAGTSDPVIDIGDGFWRFESVPVRIGDAGTIGTATGDGDLYVEDALEVDGNASVVGTLSVTGATALATASATSVAGTDDDTTIATTEQVHDAIVADVPSKTYSTSDAPGTCTQGQQWVETDDGPKLCDCYATNTWGCVVISTAP